MIFACINSHYTDLSWGDEMCFGKGGAAQAAEKQGVALRSSTGFLTGPQPVAEYQFLHL